MNRRIVVVLLAVVGVTVLALSVAIGAPALLQAAGKVAPKSPQDLKKASSQAYLSAIRVWPYTLPPGKALPKSPPSLVQGPDTARIFVSSFFVCAWQDSYLKGDPAAQLLALTNLTYWNRLPEAISGSDGSDGVWANDVIGPALRGDNGAMQRLFNADCFGDNYQRVVQKPNTGLPISAGRSVVALDANRIENPCFGVSASVPCDQAHGPNDTTDFGPRKGAQGSVLMDAAGVPTAYTVAAGDTALAVAARFGGINLFGLNCYHRTNLNLYAGDVLNLNWYTLKTVGSENGSTTPVPSADAQSCLSQSAVASQ